MFNLKYLSNERKRQLRKLQERLETAQEQRTRNEANLLIQEIQSEAESYLTCDKYKLTELKNQIQDNISTLVGLGKSESAESFRIYLKEVDFRLQTVMMEEALAEKEKLKTDEPSNLRDRIPSINDLQKEKRKKQAMGRTRWVIGMGDEDE